MSPRGRKRNQNKQDMENDPIQMRREAEAQVAKTKTLRGIMFGLAAVAVALAGVLAYVWFQKSSLVNDLEAEKQDLTEQMVALQKDYESLSSDYDSINSQLDTSRAEVAALIEQIQKTEATNRTKMRQYEKELGTLRTIMRGYITQIDSLNTLNHKLTADAAAARREAEESKKANEELSQQVASLSGQVAAGSVIKARGLRLEAYNGSDKKTDRSSPPADHAEPGRERPGAEGTGARLYPRQGSGGCHPDQLRPQPVHPERRIDGRLRFPRGGL